MSNYDIQDKGIQSSTETTSAIATISYEVENALYNGLEKDDIDVQIQDLQENNKFPSNLEFVDAKYDPQTSFSAVAFRDTNTGKVTVGFAGTNLDNGLGEKIKDIWADGSIAFNGDTASSGYFNAGNEFLQGLKNSGYELDTFTGHSLGGRNGAILGMANQIPNIVLYNAAPLSNMLTKGIASGFHPDGADARIINGWKMQKIINNYNGRLIYMISDKDPLNSLAGLFGSLYPGEKFVINNGKGHDMTGFLDKEAQSFIQRKILLVNENGELMSGVEVAQELTTVRINALATLRKKLMAGGGGLSASQEIFLDAMEAKAITEGMIITTQDKVAEIKKMYETGIENAQKLWRDTKSEAADFGEHLTSAEELSALAAGNATEASILTIPVAEYERSLSKLSAFEEKYTTLLKNIEAAITTQVAKDQELAQYFY